MKRLVFENSKFCIFLFVSFFAFMAVLSFNAKSYFNAILFLILFVLFFFLIFHQETGLLKLEVYKNKASFFIRENKKVFVKSFSFEQIEEFKLNISHMVDYNKFSSKNRAPIELNFVIKSIDTEDFNCKVNLPETLSINTVFDVLRGIPGFKFEVFTNSDSFGVSVSEYAINNKKIPIKELIDIMLKDPKVPNSSKDLISMLWWVLIFGLIFILPLVVFLIKDTVEMICR